MNKSDRLCVASWVDLRYEFALAAEAYAASPDGGYPGTPAARAYHAEAERIFNEAAQRAARMVRVCLVGVVW